MPIMKLPKYLTRYEFRGVLTAEEVKNFYGIKPDAVYGSEYWVYLSCRKAPEGGIYTTPCGIAWSSPRKYPDDVVEYLEPYTPFFDAYIEWANTQR